MIIEFTKKDERNLDLWLKVMENNAVSDSQKQMTDGETGGLRSHWALSKEIILKVAPAPSKHVRHPVCVSMPPSPQKMCHKYPPPSITFQ